MPFFVYSKIIKKMVPCQSFRARQQDLSGEVCILSSLNSSTHLEKYLNAWI